jgi:hypothetical protein
VEISLDVESELFVEFSLLWLLWVLVNIDEIPLLAEFASLGVHLDISVLNID